MLSLSLTYLLSIFISVFEKVAKASKTIQTSILLFFSALVGIKAKSGKFHSILPVREKNPKEDMSSSVFYSSTSKSDSKIDSYLSRTPTFSGDVEQFAWWKNKPYNICITQDEDIWDVI